MVSKKFKNKILGIAAEGPVYGTFVKMNCPDVIEILGLAGLDFLIVDGEHAPYNEQSLVALLRAADCVGIPVMVRVPVAEEMHILKALDMGASGVQLPGLSTVEEVRKILKTIKYAPEGSRGLSFSQRSARFGTVDRFEYMKNANENTVSVIHIENRYMADHVEELCQIEGIDILFVGPMDLSQSFNVPGNPNEGNVQNAISKITEAARNNGKQLGIFVSNKEDAVKYTKAGFHYIVIGSDQQFLMAGAKYLLAP